MNRYKSRRLLLPIPQPLDITSLSIYQKPENLLLSPNTVMEPMPSLFQKATSLQYSILTAITVRNCEVSEILSHFQANKLNLLVSWILREETRLPKSEMKGSWRWRRWAQMDACTNNALYYIRGALTFGDLNLLYWIINMPVFTLEEHAIYVFQGCLLYKHPRKDSLKQKAVSAFACKIGKTLKGPWRMVS